MNAYKKEWMISALCFSLVAITGGFISMFFVLGKDALFFGEETGYLFKSTIMGLPTHYFLLIVFSWIGATVIAAVYSLYMDRLDKTIVRGEG
jgi:putative solute:sodium symporter small subunit